MYIPRNFPDLNGFQDPPSSLMMYTVDLLDTISAVICRDVVI